MLEMDHVRKSLAEPATRSVVLKKLFLTLISMGFLRLVFSGGVNLTPPLYISRRTNLISI